MKLTLRESLLFVTVDVHYNGQQISIPNVLLDTGSASTVLAADAVAPLGIHPQPTDELRRIRGVGGVEHVFCRRIERLSIGSRGIWPFELEIGGLDYGLEMNGILGMDFLLRSGAMLDLKELSIEFVD